MLIVGAGIVGLWVARACRRAGLSVALVERDLVGAGASGGILGALTPYVPSEWSPKKAFQREGLVSLEAEIGALEEETGLSAGYARVGRLQVLASERAETLAVARQAAADEHWHGGSRRFTWETLPPSEAPAWLARESCPFGLIHDTLSARVSPRSYLSCLVKALPPEAIAERTPVAALDVAGGAARLADGTHRAAGALVVTAGAQSFPLLAPLVGQRLGHGVKGQARSLRPPAQAVQGSEVPGPDAPVLSGEGTYLIAHTDGRLALGSSVEREACFEGDAAWTAPPYLPASDTYLDKLEAMVPGLQGLPGEGWAGWRPNCETRRPLIGALPGYPRVFVATGGYGVTFGIAHLMGRSIARAITGASDPELPDTYRPAAHITAQA